MKSQMSKSELATIRADLNAVTANRADSFVERDLANARWAAQSKRYAAQLLGTVDHAIAEINRLRDSYGLLAACVGRLDFDRSESALPQTQEQWIEFVRELDDRAQRLIEDEEIERERDFEAGESA